MNVQEAVTQIIKQTGEYALVGTTTSGNDVVPDYASDNGILYYVNKAVHELDELFRVESRKKVMYYAMDAGEWRMACPRLILADSVSLKNSEDAWALVDVVEALELTLTQEPSAIDEGLPTKVSVGRMEMPEIAVEAVPLWRIADYTDINYAMRHLGNKFWVFGASSIDTAQAGWVVFGYDESFTLSVDVLQANHGREYHLSELIYFDTVDTFPNISDVGYGRLQDDSGESMLYFVTVNYVYDPGPTGDTTVLHIYDEDDTLIEDNVSYNPANVLCIKCVGNTFYVALDSGVIRMHRINLYGVGQQAEVVTPVGASTNLTGVQFLDATEDYVAALSFVAAVYTLTLYSPNMEASLTSANLTAMGVGTPYGFRIHGDDIWVWSNAKLFLLNTALEIVHSVPTKAPLADIAFKHGYMYFLYRTLESGLETVVEKVKFITHINTTTLLFNCPADENYLVQVRGRYRSPELASMYQSNYWLTAYPYLLIDYVSHLINFPRMSAASSQLIRQQLDAAIRNAMGHDVEQEVAINGTQMRG